MRRAIAEVVVSALVLVGVGLGGCTTVAGTRSITADEPRPPATAPQAATTPADQASPAMATTATGSASAEPIPMPPPPMFPPPRQRGDVSAPPPTLPLGTACTADDTARCGKKGLIAMALDPRRQTAVLPCAPTALTDDRAIYRVAACVKEDRVYASASCIACRLADAGWSVSGTIPEMTDSQLAAAQKQVGFPAEPLLRTPEAWRSAISSAAKKSKSER